MFPSDRVDQVYSQAPGSLIVALYDLQGCGGGIPTLYFNIMHFINGDHSGRAV
jgi:hypothetical protein